MRKLLLICAVGPMPLDVAGRERAVSLVAMPERYVTMQKWDTSCGRQRSPPSSITNAATMSASARSLSPVADDRNPAGEIPRRLLAARFDAPGCR